CSDDFRRQKMRVNDQVDGLIAEHAAKSRQVDLFDQEPNLVGAVAAGSARLIEHVVKKAEEMRRPVNQVNVSLGIDTSKGLVGERENVQVGDFGVGNHLPQRQLYRLGGTHVARSHRRRQNQDSRRHDAPSFKAWKFAAALYLYM